MQTPDIILRNSEQDLKSLLLRQRTIRPRFSWPLPFEQARKLLTAAYMAEVEYRARRPSLDTTTLDNISRLASALTSPEPSFGIMLCGLCGNGKTTMLYALRQATNLLQSQGQFAPIEQQGISVGMRIADAREIAELATTDRRQFQAVKRTYILGIEDMGREPTEVLDYGNILNPIVDILEHRYNEQLFTAITTNLTPKQIRDKYGVRIADRFNEMMHIIVFEGATYRHPRPSSSAPSGPSLVL